MFNRRRRRAQQAEALGEPLPDPTIPTEEQLDLEDVEFLQDLIDFEDVISFNFPHAYYNWRLSQLLQHRPAALATVDLSGVLS